MTTVYVPRLIESAEQAEALPVGTVAVDVREAATYVAVKHAPQAWWHARHRFLHGSTAVLGFEALVPIEAEEETREHPYRVEERVGYAYRQPVQQVRYKTRWEAA